MSSAEAELIALCACAADVDYCRKLPNELGFLQLRRTVIHEDNLGAKQIADPEISKDAQSTSSYAGDFSITTSIGAS